MLPLFVDYQCLVILCFETTLITNCGLKVGFFVNLKKFCAFKVFWALVTSFPAQVFNLSILISIFLFRKIRGIVTCICFSLSQKILESRCPFKPSSSPINVSWYTNSIQLPLLISLPGCKTGTLSQLHSKSVTLWIHKCFSSNAFFPFLSLLVSNFSIFL